jgi:hypothetical protein
VKSLNVIDIIKYNQLINNIEKGWVKVNKIPFIEDNEPLSEISINSEFPYGHSLNCGRLMVYYSHYMFNHIYSSIMTDEVNLFFTKELNKNEDFNIKIVSKSGLNKDTIKSLVLDVFNFDLEDFKTKVKDYDLTQDILDPMGKKPYLIQDRLEDTIVF